MVSNERLSILGKALQGEITTPLCSKTAARRQSFA